MGQAALVDGFQQTRTKSAVDLKSRVDDDAGKVLETRLDAFVSFPSFVSFVFHLISLSLYQRPKHLEPRPAIP